MAKNTQSRALVKATRQLMAEERSLTLLPLMGTLLALLSFVVLGLPALYLLTHMHLHLGRGNIVEAVAFFPAGIAMSFSVILSNSAITIAAGQRLRTGTNLSLGQALSQAWAKKGLILRWSVFATAVGTLINQLRRYGVAGEIAASLAGLAWAVAIFFVVPVLVFEGLGPTDAVKRSATVLKTTFGDVARSQIRISVRILGWLALTFVGIVIGLTVLLMGLGTHVLATAVLGGTILGLSVLAMIYLIAWSSAITSYLRTILYFYATATPMPDLGVDLSTTFH